MTFLTQAAVSYARCSDTQVKPCRVIGAVADVIQMRQTIFRPHLSAFVNGCHTCNSCTRHMMKGAASGGRRSGHQAVTATVQNAWLAAEVGNLKGMGLPSTLCCLIWAIQDPPQQLLQVRHGGRCPLVADKGATRHGCEPGDRQGVGVALVHERRGATPVGSYHCGADGMEPSSGSPAFAHLALKTSTSGPPLC